MKYHLTVLKTQNLNTNIFRNYIVKSFEIFYYLNKTMNNILLYFAS